MKKLILFCSIVLISASVALGQASLSTITFSEPNANLPALGSTFDVPVNVAGFPASVRYVEFYMNFDPGVLNYLGFANPQHAGFSILSQIVSPGVVKINYNNVVTPFNLVDGKLIDLQFVFSGGNSPLTFSNAKYRVGAVITEITDLTNGAVLGGFLDNYIAGGLWETPVNWSLGVVPNHFHNVFVEPGLASINSSAKCNNLTIFIGGELTVMGGHSLAVAGDIFIDGDETGTGSFANKGTFTHSGTATIKQFMTGFDKWHLVSLPVTQVWSYDVFLHCYLKTYNETTGLYVDVQSDPGPGGTQLLNTPMKGYAAAYNGGQDNMLTFTGTFNDGIKSIPVQNLGTTGNVNRDGWNLVGNPYPSALDNDAAGWVRTNVGAAVSYWDQGLNGGMGGWATWVSGAGTNGGSQFIPPMQGFFVKATSNGTLGVNNSLRAHADHMWYKNDISNTLRLAVNGGQYMDESVIRFSAEASLNYDELLDAFKLQVAEQPQVYSVTANNEELAINTLEVINADVPVLVAFNPGVSNQYTLNVTGIETFSSTVPIWLVDNKTGISVDLRNTPSYTFAAETGDDINRFSITFKNLTGLPGVDNLNANIYSFDGNVYIDATSVTNGEVTVMNLLGQELFHSKLNQDLNIIPMPVKNSFVLVKAISDQGTVTKKVFIK